MAEPLRRLIHALLHADAVRVGDAEIERGIGVALRCGLAIPGHGLIRVAADAQAFAVHHGDVVFGLGDAGIGRRLEELSGALIVLLSRPDPAHRARRAGTARWRRRSWRAARARARAAPDPSARCRRPARRPCLAAWRAGAAGWAGPRRGADARAGGGSAIAVLAVAVGAGVARAAAARLGWCAPVGGGAGGGAAMARGGRRGFRGRQARQAGNRRQIGDRAAGGVAEAGRRRHRRLRGDRRRHRLLPRHRRQAGYALCAIVVEGRQRWRIGRRRREQRCIVGRSRGRERKLARRSGDSG